MVDIVDSGSTDAATTLADSVLRHCTTLRCSSVACGTPVGGASAQWVSVTSDRFHTPCSCTCPLAAAMRWTSRPLGSNSKMRMLRSTPPLAALPTLIEYDRSPSE